MSKHLTIAEVARETGLNPATLRAWENRHGFPRPRRLPGGHRRYRQDDVEAVRRVVAERAAGATLRGAIARAVAVEEETGGSFFAELRWGEQRLEPQVVTKTTLTAVSHAIEDECSARAERAVLVGAFQQRRFYERARRRWRDLAQGARRAVVFADFEHARCPEDEPAEVPIRHGDPLEREWVLIHLAPRSSVLLLGREVPGQTGCTDAARRFEFGWSAEPSPVRKALDVAVRLARKEAPAVGAALAADLEVLPPPLGLDPGFLTALTNRMVGYLDRW